MVVAQVVLGLPGCVEQRANQSLLGAPELPVLLSFPPGGSQILEASCWTKTLN